MLKSKSASLERKGGDGGGLISTGTMAGRRIASIHHQKFPKVAFTIPAWEREWGNGMSEKN